MAEMKPLTLEKLVWPTLHDSSTKNTMSACTTVLHAEGRRTEELVRAQITRSVEQYNICLKKTIKIVVCSYRNLFKLIYLDKIKVNLS